MIPYISCIVYCQMSLLVENNITLAPKCWKAAGMELSVKPELVT